jgi:nucleotide-binding universal stress UspA family protein
MTDVLDPHTSNAARRKPGGTAERHAPLRILAVLDGSESTGQVTKYLLDLHAGGGALEVVLLNVQPAPEVGRLRGYGSFRRADVDDRLGELGRRVVTSAARHLDAARVPHKDRIELGEPVQTIVACADEEKCDLIVLGESSPGALRRWLMRTTGVVVNSVASVVIHLAHARVLIAR